MNIDNAKLLDQLLKAEAETDVEAILQRAGYLTDDDSIWKPFGGNEMNFSQINNQQADPTPASPGSIQRGTQRPTACQRPSRNSSRSKMDD
jgi:hypothetical protein